MYALEGLLQFLGVIALVDGWESASKPGNDALRKTLNSARLDRGSLGLWAFALKEVFPLIPDPFMSELQPCVADPEFRRLLDALVDGRNDLAHPIRMTSRSEALDLLTPLRDRFEALCERLAFLGDYQLLGLREERYRITKGHQIHAVSLSGRNPSWTAVAIDVRESMDAGDVVLVNPSGDSALVLRPFYRMPDDEGERDVLAYARTVKPGSLQHYYCIATDRRVRDTALTLSTSREVGPA